MPHRLSPPSSTEPASRRARRAGSIAGRLVTSAVMVLVPLTITACGGGDSSSSSSAAPLSAAAERGRSTALDSGCASCHGPTWQGGVAPSWVGLAGSTVTLSDGSTVTADAAYLARSIMAPADQMVQGYSIVMPTNGLTADEVADVVAFIQALTPSEDE
jgi:cytochrome c oxidase subunit 2